MFNNKGNKENMPASKTVEGGNSSINLIGAGTVIEGDIRSNGDIRIDGTVIGHVILKAKVVIGAKGKTAIAELLFLKSASKVIGDIVTGKLVVEVGATFTGSCNMGPVIKDIKDADKSIEINKEKTA